jgi:hypothetical protein
MARVNTMENNTKKDATYKGHKNRNHWNVSLWITKDESLYRTALECIKQSGDTPDYTMAAENFLELLAEGAEAGKPPKTPDGVTYTKTTVLAALRGLE